MWLSPDWPAPKNVLALSTTRYGGNSVGLYRGLNLGDHVGDDADVVAQNRAVLAQRLPEGATIQWLQQTHSTKVIEAKNPTQIPQADASFSTTRNQFCCVMTADCLPLLLCNTQGTQVAAVHAGWRGLCDGIIEQAVARFNQPAEQLLAWMGPAIGPSCFEVGAEVRQQFIDCDPQAQFAFTPVASANTDARFADAKYLANIYQLAQQRLQSVGVSNIYGGQHCTVSDPSRFYSYRRNGVTGRQATLIGLL